MTNVRDTSIAAYKDILSGLPPKRARVLGIIKREKNVSNSELSVFLGWPINTVTPRVNELRRLGLVFGDGKRICKITGRRVHVWEVEKTCRFGHMCTSRCGNDIDCPCQSDHCCALTEDCEGPDHCDDHYVNE